MSDWHMQRSCTGGEEWFPIACGHPKKQALPRFVEDAIRTHLKDTFMNTGLGANRSILRQLALNAYGSMDEEDVHTERFCASPNFCRGFEDQQGITLRTPHPERRTDRDEDQVSHFLQRLEEVKATYPLSRIYNCDETCWRCIVGPKKVYAEKGSTTVKLKGFRSVKTSCTAIGTMTAAGGKLPLWVILKGLTDRSLVKCGLHPKSILTHTDNGWTTENIMLEYLNWIHLKSDNQPCALISDVYASHRTDKVNAFAAEKGIELLFVPAGGTSRFQPLDVRIFGELKVRAREKFTRLAWARGEWEGTFDEAITILEQTWSMISPDNVKKAWMVK
jgi:hypothetical protein